jgi:hypothetical protein
VKVNLYETVEVSDEQRVKLAQLIDGAGAKKRQATRDEIKDYIWLRGKKWAEDLGDEGPPTPNSTDEPDDDDLI